MKNNIECLIRCKNTSSSLIASALKIDLSLLNYCIKHPEEDIPYEMAEKLAQYFDVDKRFLLGLPCKYRKNYEDLDESELSDIQNASYITRPYIEYFIRGGYYNNETTLNSYKGTGFIAMSFNFHSIPELISIKDTFKQAICQAGYIPKIMNEVQSNNYITIDIFNEIRKCDFLVLDTTVDNCGAYYEAGYAKALGKPVIICCKKSKFDAEKDHFDISQINHILWTDLDDLLHGLVHRIRSTVL